MDRLPTITHCLLPLFETVSSPCRSSQTPPSCSCRIPTTPPNGRGSKYRWTYPCTRESFISIGDRLPHCCLPLPNQSCQERSRRFICYLFLCAGSSSHN